MKIQDVIRAAIPGASDELCEFIVWERTPAPVGAITARSLYKAADRFRRAEDNGIRLCEMCDRIARDGHYLCAECKRALLYWSEAA